MTTVGRLSRPCVCGNMPRATAGWLPRWVLGQVAQRAHRGQGTSPCGRGGVGGPGSQREPTSAQGHQVLDARVAGAQGGQVQAAATRAHMRGLGRWQTLC